MAIVIPRARSSGALSIESNERYSASPFIASTIVIAAVSVVFPWSTCPIVPTFTCGFVRSNFCFAIFAGSWFDRGSDWLAGAAHGLRDLGSCQNGGAHERNRTADLLLTMQMLYR